MGKIKTLLTALAGNPIYSIGVVLATALLIFGVYSVGPWYTGGTTTALGAVFDTQNVRSIVSMFYIVPSAGVLWGIKHRRHRAWSTFGTSLSYFFLATLRLVTIGPVPMIWLFILGCGLVMGIVYLYVSLKDEGKSEHGLL